MLRNCPKMQLSGGLVPGVNMQMLLMSAPGTCVRDVGPERVSVTQGYRDAICCQEGGWEQSCCGLRIREGDHSALLMCLTFIVSAGYDRHNTYRGYILGIINRHFLDFLSVQYSANTSVLDLEPGFKLCCVNNCLKSWFHNSIIVWIIVKGRCLHSYYSMSNLICSDNSSYQHSMTFHI